MNAHFKLSRTKTVLFLLLAVFSRTIFADDQLPEKWRTWLDETVIYIISEAERDAFLQLDSEERRERFRELFWEMRDPTPGTEKNEYKEEHFRRIEHANKFFGRDTFREGWRTDRGKMYILLGEPKTIDRYPSTSTLFPLELWMYQSERKDVGLPNFFYLIFFQPHNVGELQLYTPGRHLPSDLVPGASKGEDVLAQVNRVNPELASAVVSLVAGESGIYDPLTPSFSSMRLMAGIGNLPNRMVDPSWATDFLESRAEVAVKYQFINIQVPHVIHPMVDPAGFAFIDYAFLLPQDSLEVGQYKSNIYGGWDIEVFLADEQGTIVLQDARRSELDLPAEKINSLQNTSFRFMDRLAVKPGKYTISIRVKNRVTRKAFAITDEVVVSGAEQQTAQAGKVMLAAQFEPAANRKSQTTFPFEASFGRLMPAVGSILNLQPDKRPYAFCQFYGLDPNGEMGKITLVILKSAGEQVGATSRAFNPKAGVNSQGIFEFLGPLPVGELAPGQYTFALVLEVDGQRISAVQPFQLLGKDSPKTYDLLLLNGERKSAGWLRRYGGMLALQGDAARAARMFELAKERSPLAIKDLLLFADQLSKVGQPDRAIKVIEERMVEKPNEPALIQRLASLYLETGDTRSAVRYLKRAVFTRSLDASGLALLADLEIADGNRESLISYLQEIQKINADWQDLAKLLDRLENTDPK